MRRFFALSAFFALAGLARADAIDRLIESAMKAQHVPGLSLEIVRDGKVIKRTGYGFADLEAQVKMTPECVLEIGSITKQFTAASVLLLQDRGQLSVDDTLGKYLTELPEAWQKLTIRQVMSHTSG